MKRIKKSVILLVALCMLLGLSACGNFSEIGEMVDDMVGAMGEEGMTKLVQGNLDVIYLGKYNEEYLELVTDSVEELEQEYLTGLEMEAEYFANYWGIVDASYGESYSDLEADLKQDILELYKEIYSHSKYQVQDAARMDDGSYVVKVLVEPIDIMEQAVDLYDTNGYEPLNALWTKYAEVDFSTMSDEDYWAYTHEYGEVIVQMVRDQLPNLGYMEQKSQSIQVENVDGSFQINMDDFVVFDGYVIYYP